VLNDAERAFRIARDAGEGRQLSRHGRDFSFVQDLFRIAAAG
jgi:hypothetical protein